MKNEKKELTSDNAELLRGLVGAFIGRPKDVKITSKLDRAGEILVLQVHREDHSRVVGSLGRHIQALRTIFEFIGARDNVAIRVLLLDQAEGRGGPMLEFKANMSWSASPMTQLLRQLLKRILRREFTIEITSVADTTNVLVKTHAGDQELAEALGPYLQPIFRAIGKQQGRRVYLDVGKQLTAVTA